MLEMNCEDDNIKTIINYEAFTREGLLTNKTGHKSNKL